MNVLLTSAGRRSYIVQYFREALDADSKVIVANTIADAPAMQAADIAIQVPASHEPSYIPTLLEICHTYQVRLLLSLHDLDTKFLAPHRQKFYDLNVVPVISEPCFVDTCYDKFATVDFIKTIGLPYCPTYLGLDDTLAAVDAAKIRFPIILKPRTGFGSIGLYITHDERDIRDCYRLLRKDIVRSPICNSPNFDIESAAIFQQLVQGDEYGLDVVNDLKGNFSSVIVEKKLAMRSGETDSAIIVDEPILFELGRTISLHSKHLGVLDLDVIIENGRPYILEMNPRFGGHYPFAHLAGANIPAAIIAWAHGRNPDPLWLRAETGVKGYKELVPTRISYEHI
jgi:carbamoyl-phosphate synthase large subunit